MPPKFVRPCIVPHGEGWLHEPKLDGYCLQIVTDGDALRLYSRSGYDWTKRLAVVADALATIRCQSAVIDCELIFPTKKGHRDFRSLQAAIGDRKRHHELAVLAFHLLHYYDEIDFRPIPLIERRLQPIELEAASHVSYLQLVQEFDKGAELRGAWCGSAVLSDTVT